MLRAVPLALRAAHFEQIDEVGGKAEVDANGVRLGIEIPDGDALEAAALP